MANMKKCSIEDAIELIKDSTHNPYDYRKCKKLISTETPLTEIRIDPLEVMKMAFRQEGIEEESNDVTVESDDMTITTPQNVVKLSKPISELFTIRDLAEILNESWIFCWEYECYDLISECAYSEWFTLMNSSASCCVDKAIVDKVRLKYNVKIRFRPIENYDGTVQQLAEYLTETINKALNRIERIK